MAGAGPSRDSHPAPEPSQELGLVRTLPSARAIPAAAGAARDELGPCSAALLLALLPGLWKQHPEG